MSPSAPTRSRILRSTSPVRPTTRQWPRCNGGRQHRGRWQHQHDRLTSYRPQPDQRGGVDHIAAYAQSNFGAFVNSAVGNGRWVDNNIASFSSTGFTQAGNTVNLVAPGTATGPSARLTLPCTRNVLTFLAGLTSASRTSAARASPPRSLRPPPPT